MNVEAQGMRIVINGREDLVSVDPGSCMGDVLDEVRDLFRANRIAILEMRLDGEPFENAQQDALRSDSTDSYGALEVEAVELEVLFRDVLASIREHLPRVSERLTDITAKIQGGDVTEAFARLDEVLEAWGLVLGAVENLRRLLSLSNLSILGVDEVLAVREEQLRKLLEEVRDAIRNQDLVTLGDCLEYELSPMVREWTDVVDSLEKAVASGNTSSE
ncbi:MAG: hypothetical protein HY720_12450 [Planctomycetes bacterium]|nr:hypothetical protein [Planctomycetota bacterium]